MRRSVVGILGIGIVLAFVLGVARADVTVFAAASLKDALDELAARYHESAREKVTVSYAASSALAQHIVQGAPADIFVSADLDWMDYVEQRKLTRPGSRVDLLSNGLVLVAPRDSLVSLAIAPRFPLGRMLGDRRLAMADPDYVPAGKYGRAALERLDVWRDVSGRLARAENVRAALALVARGEAPFGIVYRTDALAEPRVRVIGEFAPTLHPPIRYPAAILARSRAAGATGFLAYVRSPPARRVWERNGFSVVGQ